MPILNHYTAVYTLPPIMAEGLRLGEIATNNVRSNHVAVSLTTQTDPDTLACWAGQQPHKTAVRLVCKINGGDARLEPALAAWKRLGVPPKFIRESLNPHGQAKWWYFYHGTIAPAEFAVELRGRNEYHPFPSLDKVLTEVAAARDFYTFFVPDGFPWAQAVKLKNPESEDGPGTNWIFNEVFPAERFK